MQASTESRPRAGVDYPGTWPAFREWFPDDAACAVFLERLRWPDGFVCPACGQAGGWRVGGGRHDLRGHADAAEFVVRGGLVCDQPEAGAQRARASERVGAWQLPDRMDDD